MTTVYNVLRLTLYKWIPTYVYRSGHLQPPRNFSMEIIAIRSVTQNKVAAKVKSGIVCVNNVIDIESSFIQILPQIIKVKFVISRS